MEVKASEFKTHCLKLLDNVCNHGGEVIITKRGKPVARLIPCERAEKPAQRLGRLGALGISVGDIVGPFDEEWPDS